MPIVHCPIALTHRELELVIGRQKQGPFDSREQNAENKSRQSPASRPHPTRLMEGPMPHRMWRGSGELFCFTLKVIQEQGFFSGRLSGPFPQLTVQGTWAPFPHGSLSISSASPRAAVFGRPRGLNKLGQA